MSIPGFARICRRLAIAIALAVPGFLQAQDQASVAGVVTDASTARPLFGAIVVLSVPSGTRTARTDQAGTFTFFGVPTGTHTLTVRQIGYTPRTETIAVTKDAHLTIALERVAALDTVRVRAARQAIYGVVAASADLRPLANSTVDILGASTGRVTTDSAGRFFYSAKSTGAYLVRAKASGFVTRSVSVTLEKEDGVEVVLVLDDDGGKPNHAIEAAYFDFRSRLARRGRMSALVPRSELIEYQDASLIDALLATPLFASKGLRFTSEACVFLDGTPRAGLSINAIDVREVETVEVYSKTGEKSRTLQDKWPKPWRCGDTGLQRAGGAKADDELVYWVVIWLRH